MKTLEAIIEDPQGNVIGALTNEGSVMLPDGQTFPRSELATHARDLAQQLGIKIPTALLPLLPPE